MILHLKLNEQNDTRCNRCGRVIAIDEAGACWWCNADLCFDCWDLYGHCGHPDADRFEANLREAMPHQVDTESACEYGYDGSRCVPAAAW